MMESVGERTTPWKTPVWCYVDTVSLMVIYALCPLMKLPLNFDMVGGLLMFVYELCMYMQCQVCQLLYVSVVEFG